MSLSSHSSAMPAFSYRSKSLVLSSKPSSRASSLQRSASLKVGSVSDDDAVDNSDSDAGAESPVVWDFSQDDVGFSPEAFAKESAYFSGRVPWSRPCSPESFSPVTVLHGKIATWSVIDISDEEMLELHLKNEGFSDDKILSFLDNLSDYLALMEIFEAQINAMNLGSLMIDSSKGEIGKGSFGSVKLGFYEDAEGDLQVVAVKKVSVLDSSEAVFQQQAAELGASVTIHEQLTHGKNAYLIMDMLSLQGDMLAMSLSQVTAMLTEMPEHANLVSDALIGITHDLVAAMASCHQSGVVHGDPKIQNTGLSPVSADEQASMVFVDWGKSRDASSTEVVEPGTITHAPFASYQHLVSPSITDDHNEQGPGLKSPFKQDLFALGVTLLEYVTGKAPDALLEMPYPKTPKTRADFYKRHQALVNLLNDPKQSLYSFLAGSGDLIGSPIAEALGFSHDNPQKKADLEFLINDVIAPLLRMETPAFEILAKMDDQFSEYPNMAKVGTDLIDVILQKMDEAHDDGVVGDESTTMLTLRPASF